MYVVSYRYRVPRESEAAYTALQSRVSELYLKHGCLAYTILKPLSGTTEYVELSCFTDKRAFEQTEQALASSGLLGPLFEEFLSITRLSERDLVQMEFETAIDRRR